MWDDIMGTVWAANIGAPKFTVEFVGPFATQSSPIAERGGDATASNVCSGELLNS